MASTYSDNQQSPLLNLSFELLASILSFLPPLQLVDFGRTCHAANAFISPNNRLLWKYAFLQVFDHPKHAWEALTPTASEDVIESVNNWDWFSEVKRRYSAIHSVTKGAGIESLPLEEVVTTLVDIVQTASYNETPDSLRPASLNLQFLDRFFKTNKDAEAIVHDYIHSLPSHRPILRSMVTSAAKTPTPEWASRFHTYYGMTSREESSIIAKAAARELVYDWAITGVEADYGPFQRDRSGRINWAVLEAVTSLMNRIFDGNRSSLFRTPSTLNDNIPFTLPLTLPHDWAGVSRAWVGTYAFLDYRALIHYNFANLDYTMTDLGSHEEACGDIMQLTLELDDSEEAREDPKLMSTLPRCEDLPVLYFSGSSTGPSASGGRPLIRVRGTASFCPGGREVRWRFIIRLVDSG